MGLLAVSEAACLPLRSGGVTALSPEPGSWALLAPIQGKARLAWGDRSWLLAGECAAALRGGEELSLLSPEDGALLSLTLRGSVADAVLGEEQRRSGLYFDRGGHAVRRLWRQLGPDMPPQEVSALCYQLLMELSGTGSPAPADGAVLPLVVEAALGILRREFAFLDGVAELAARLEVSQEYLTRCFRASVGITPGKYLVRLRIENAKRLLRQGGHSIAFVSDACGFTNSNYFARVFRENVGMNPREYARNLHPERPQPLPEEDTMYLL